MMGIMEGPAAWPDRGGTAAIEPGEAVAAFAGWHPAVRQMVAAGDVECRWGLFVARRFATGIAGRSS